MWPFVIFNFISLAFFKAYSKISSDYDVNDITSNKSKYENSDF